MNQRPDYTLVQLQYFMTAADAGSMTAAAESLHVAQSAVSTAVANLERSTGLQLFIRHHARGLSLTADGDQFLRRARNLLMQAAELANAAADISKAAAGKITIGCFTTLAPFHLPRLLSDLAVEFPLLDIDIVEGETGFLQAALRSGQCELAVMYDLDPEPDLDRELLSVAPPYAILAPDHPIAAAGRGAWLRDLAKDPMVLLDLPHSRDYFRTLVASSGVEPQVRYRTAGYETVRALVARGHGFSILNQKPLSATTYDGGKVAVVPLLDKLAPLPIVLARLHGLRLSARGEAFAVRCRTIFRQLG